MSLLDDWQRKVAEGDRRERLRQRLATEGLGFVRQYAESCLPEASKALSTFLQSEEGRFIQQWLARVQPDLVGMTSSHAEMRSSLDFTPPDAEDRAPWNDARFLSGTWEDWQRAVRDKVNHHMVASSRLRGLMSHALRGLPTIGGPT